MTEESLPGFDTPPSNSPLEGQEEKKPAQIHSTRPNCPMCGQAMHAMRTKQVRSSHQVYRFYYCKNDDCTNTRGQQVVLNTEAKRIIEATDTHGRIREMNVAARPDMQDTDGN